MNMDEFHALPTFQPASDCHGINSKDSTATPTEGIQPG